MSSMHAPRPRKCKGFSRGIADRYSEDRWKVRYKRKESVLLDLCPWAASLEYLDDDFPCDDPPEPPHVGVKGPKEDSDASRLSGLWVRAEQILAVAPTAILFGAYGAIVFHFLSLGPAWAGFLTGAAPVSGLAVWAFGGLPRS